MQAVENTSSGEESISDDPSDVLEMHSMKKQPPHPRGEGGKKKSVDDHTEEYWASSGRPRKVNEKSKADWVKKEEGLNKGHRACESFAVLNELVVVRPPSSYTWRDR